jgi:hypothetical protein
MLRKRITSVELFQQARPAALHGDLGIDHRQGGKKAGGRPSWGLATRSAPSCADWLKLPGYSNWAPATPLAAEGNRK